MATAIPITDLTNGAINNHRWEGTGVFDDLMEAVNDNIATQYNLGRIKGSDYANVYLGSLQTVISESIRFLMESQITAAQIDKIAADTDLAEAAADQQYAEMLANIDKVYGFDYTLNPDLTIDRTSLVDAGDGRLDYEREKLAAETDIAKAQLSLTQAKTMASIDKEFGFDYTIDGDGNIIIGADQGDGKLDAEVAEMEARVELVNTQADLAYTEQIIKDKEAILAGLDDAILITKDAKTGTTVHTPLYTAN